MTSRDGPCNVTNRVTSGSECAPTCGAVLVVRENRDVHRGLRPGAHSLPGGVRLVTWTPYRLSAIGVRDRTLYEGCTHSRGVSDWLHVRPELDLWVALTPGGVRLVTWTMTGCHRLACFGDPTSQNSRSSPPRRVGAGFGFWGFGV
jgi:hypothetical protein